MIVKDIITKIKSYERIIIHRHVRPDPDALGSQVGLAEIIKTSFPDKEVFVVGDEEESLLFLAKMDQIEDDKFNGALAIICDAANQERISDKRYLQAKELIKIDHHPEVDIYGDISWINTQSSSTSEMIYELFVNGEEFGIKVSDHAAMLLYAGIVGDTGRFLFPSATDITFQYASELVKYDFNRTELYDNLYRMNENIAHLKGYILQNFTVSPNGVSAIKITKDILAEYYLTPEETSKLVGVLGEIEGIRAWVIFVEDDALIRVRLRSKGPVIHKIAAKFNGGGHPLASGATIYDWKETEAVIAELEQACRQYAE